MVADKKILLLSQKTQRLIIQLKKIVYIWNDCKSFTIAKLPDGTLKVLVEGISRAKVNSLSFNKDFINATIIELKNTKKIIQI